MANEDMKFPEMNCLLYVKHINELKMRIILKKRH